MTLLTVDPAQPDAATLRIAADWLRQGGVVAYPTDTLYGLAVDPSSAAAVEALFDVKGRDARSALPLLAASVEQVRAACGALPPDAARLAAAFWPGPLSLILDAPALVAPAVHAGTGTVAVRVPAHPVARALAEAFGGLVTATSANLSGQPPSATAAGLDAIARDPRVMGLDGGAAPGGAPSTIVDARGELRLVRAGPIAWNRVLESLER
jgi:L-threonylcarbamoyladenylate synthase